MAADYGIISWASTTETIIRASNLASNAGFGVSVAIDGDYAIVGARQEDGSNIDPNFNCGAAYIFERTNGVWSEKQILRASNFGASDSFGSVAISGNYAIVGAFSEDGTSISATTDNCGAAYIFERDISGNWIQKQILRASNVESNDEFGRSVAISGNYAIVGAQNEDGSSIDPNFNSGAAYIFERDDSGNWTEKPILRASNFDGGDQFGRSVAISGNYAIVGAYSEDGTSISATTDNCGAAYIFERDISGNWTEKKLLRASNFGGNDYFGWSVSISGNYAIVGALQEDGSNTGANFNCGAAYIFERNGSGVWNETQILRASNLGATDNFGNSVSISGNYAIVGAINEDGTSISATTDNCGAAYIFERDASGNWAEKQILRASNLGQNDQFGDSVAISGNSVFVGAYSEDGTSNQFSSSGAVYIYTATLNPTPLSLVDDRLTITNSISSTDTDVVSFALNAGTRLYPFSVSTFTGTGTVTYTLAISGGANVATGTFSSAGATLLPGDRSLTASVNTTYVLTLTANATITYTIIGYLDYEKPPSNIWAFPTETILRASNLDLGDRFGQDVAIDGDYAIIGAISEDGSNIDPNFNCGAAYIFERTNGVWSEKQILRASNFGASDLFGEKVAISGNYAIVGTNYEDGNGDIYTESGAAYIFERDISGNWIQKQILRASNIQTYDYFGSVAISGNYVIIGASAEDGSSIDTEFNCGAAYIFERDVSGNWIQKKILRASNFGGNDRFGASVSISGNYAIVGANYEDGSSTSTEFNSGAAYIFERDGSGNWLEKQILRASNLGATDYFGGSVSISGNYAIVGATGEDGTSISATTDGCGAAYIFERDGSGNWSEKQILRASNLGGGDYFGTSVAISGNYAIVAAYAEDGSSTDAAFNCGATYIFERIAGVWTETRIIRASNFDTNDYFAIRIAISGNNIIVGAMFEDGSNTSSNFNCGAAYIYSANLGSTPISFVNNTLTITNPIDATDTDFVSFALNTGTTLFPLNVSTFTGTGTVTYTLAVSGGANVVTGTFSSAGVNILTSGALTASANTTYYLTLTANSSITYSIFGLLTTGSFTYSNLVTSGFSIAQLATAGYNIVNLKANGVTDAQLSVAGYTFDQFASFGIIPAWSSDASANHLIKSYIKDFVDVSGIVVLRENSNLHVNGNTETAGNVSLNRLFVTSDASFNRRIFVGGDVSMNGNVAMIGDLSMNGSVTKSNFNNSSIPKSAFSGAVPDGADYNTSRIVYDQTFQANDDVSMNGLIVAANNVKVSGNIVFNDGTVMNTYDNNILSTNPTVFNSSTFTALDICGNLVAGSYATSSDYRIKTNIVELDETYTVDKLRPVKYYQTQINREKYGLIAHELQEHYPELVIGEKDGNELQRVNYTGLIAILINDIKRLKRELTELENDVVVGKVDPLIKRIRI